MAQTRLEAATPGGSVLMVCSCGARELHSTRDGARAARAAHEIRAHSLTARTSPGAWAVRKARQRARERA